MKRYMNDAAGMFAVPDGEWVRYEDHVEAMKRIAGDSAQQAEPAVVRKTFIFDGVRNPDFVPLRIEFESGYPEDVAFGTQRQMDRLKKWLDKFFAMRTAQSASPAALTDEQIIALADRGEHLTPSPSKYPELGHGTQYSCGASGLLGFARALLTASPADQESRHE